MTDVETPEPPAASDRAAPPIWPGWVRATAQCLRFYSRLSVPRLPGEADPHAIPDFRVIVQALPLAGALIGGVGAAVLILAVALDFPASLAGLLAVTTLVIVTGAFHEDGIADVADGFWGGATRERRLEILKDSRVGTFGASALILSIGLRAAALGGLLGALGAVATAAAMIGAAALSRAFGLAVLTALPPARADGASAVVGQPTRASVALALGLSLVLCLPFAALTPGPVLALAPALAASALATLWLIRLSREKIGGQTGDVAGAAQQLAETAFYLAILAAGR